MRIEKYVTVNAEVEVDIGIDDIVACIHSRLDPEDETMQQCIERGLNNALMFVKGVPDEEIRALRPAVREVLIKVLREQADRYANA